jgi:hypothetical protein
MKMAVFRNVSEVLSAYVIKTLSYLNSLATNINLADAPGFRGTPVRKYYNTGGFL